MLAVNVSGAPNGKSTLKSSDPFGAESTRNPNCYGQGRRRQQQNGRVQVETSSRRAVCPSAVRAHSTQEVCSPQLWRARHNKCRRSLTPVQHEICLSKCTKRRLCLAADSVGPVQRTNLEPNGRTRSTSFLVDSAASLVARLFSRRASWLRSSRCRLCGLAVAAVSISVELLVSWRRRELSAATRRRSRPGNQQAANTQIE